jgi:hypothetical protein
MLEPIKCSNMLCQYMNPNDARYCLRCGSILDPEKYLSTQPKWEEEIQKVKDQMEAIPNMIKEICEMKGKTGQRC